MGPLRESLTFAENSVKMVEGPANNSDPQQLLSAFKRVPPPRESVNEILHDFFCAGCNERFLRRVDDP